MAAPESIRVSESTEYPAGTTFDVSYDAFAVRQTILAGGELRFRIADGPYARTETVTYVALALRPGVFIVSWVEESGATVVHVEDFVRAVVYSHATLRDGTFLRLQGPMRIVGTEAA